MPTYRTAAVDTIHNDEELWLNLDLLEEKRERAVICEAKAKMKITKYYNARVRGVAFRPRDFVYPSNDASHVAASGKLRPKPTADMDRCQSEEMLPLGCSTCIDEPSLSLGPLIK
ncbi:hypothetical protein Tco_0055017, partial [Tanacetum coccineum]